LIAALPTLMQRVKAILQTSDPEVSVPIYLSSINDAVVAALLAAPEEHTGRVYLEEYRGVHLYRWGCPAPYGGYVLVGIDPATNLLTKVKLKVLRAADDRRHYWEMLLGTMTAVLRHAADNNNRKRSGFME
jgi:hypothetical protein